MSRPPRERIEHRLDGDSSYLSRRICDLDLSVRAVRDGATVVLVVQGAHNHDSAAWGVNHRVGYGLRGDLLAERLASDSILHVCGRVPHALQSGETGFDSLRELDRERGSFNAQVTPGKRAGQDWESAHSTAGELLILAVRLAERFEPKALRERLEILAASAVQQGDTQQAGNTRRAQEFLDALAGDTAKSQDKSEELVDQEEQGPSGHDAEG